MMVERVIREGLVKTKISFEFDHHDFDWDTKPYSNASTLVTPPRRRTLLVCMYFDGQRIVDQETYGVFSLRTLTVGKGAPRGDF
jgi:hypothetical protein